ncbi:glycosyltransferase family 2 protein [Aeromonas veronii]|uniref:glycosyltransferase family 2 protein n=1 Tax=Aeromonas veronii TaxID=654 RepID=UPI0005A7697A|nr:glycosyltransferase family A protein [Aeromonas veronii]
MSVSIITPVYNESRNLNKVYNKLCKQDRSNFKFEWVLIDDGSIDNSKEIIEEIIRNHNPEWFNITFIQQKNSGAAAARRNGIINSKHDIITILDADDELSDDALRFAFSKISEKVDIVCFRVEFLDSDGRFESEFKYSPTEWPVSGQQAFSECIDGWGLTGWFMVKKGIILKAYEYADNYLHGNTVNFDEFVSRLCMYNATQVDICDGVYFYYNNPQSTTKNVNQNYYKTIYTALALNSFIFEFCDEGLRKKSHRHLLATNYGICVRYFKWGNKLLSPKDWFKAMQEIAHTIDILIVLRSMKVSPDSLKIVAKLMLTMLIRWR